MSLHRLPLLVRARVPPWVRDVNAYLLGSLKDLLGDERGVFAPIFGGGTQRLESVGLDTANSIGTQVTANASVGSDGAWTQLITSTGFAYHALWIVVHYGGTTTGRLLIDFAIGGSGAEKILIADLPHLQIGANARCGTSTLWIPLHVPSGARIAARAHRGSVASINTKVSLVGMNGPVRGLPPFHRCTTYGTDLTNVRGTTVDPGGTASTQGAKTQIVASTTNRIRALYAMTMRNVETAQASNVINNIQHFVGASTAEQPITPEYPTWNINSTTDLCEVGGHFGPVPVDIAAGSRLTAAARSLNITVGERESQVSYLALD